MAGNSKETILISLGGSLVAPREVDLGFLKSFKHSLQKYFGAKKFLIFVGGGKTARVYQKALLDFGANSSARDWMGINASRLNAEVVKQAFVGFSYPKVIVNPNVKVKTNKSVAVGAGYKPGWSTDYCSVLAARAHGISTIVNLTNIDYVYDKNPSRFPDAKPLKEVSWKSFKSIVGDKWTPGLSMPFDPRASKIAEKLKIRVVMINGGRLDRFEDFLNNKPFIGTIIQ